MLRSYLKERRARKVLARYVNPEAVKAILNGDYTKQPPFKATLIEFVLIYVDGQTPEEISTRVGNVCGVAISHGGMIHNNIGALIVIAFGTHPTSLPTTGKRAALVEHLTKEFSGHLKIVHGAADGHFGIIGNGVCLSYSFLVPKFDMILGRLSQIEFGQIVEFEK